VPFDSLRVSVARVFGAGDRILASFRPDTTGPVSHLEARTVLAVHEAMTRHWKGFSVVLALVLAGFIASVMTAAYLAAICLVVVTVISGSIYLVGEAAFAG